jgi:hypothetical protein
MPLRVYPDSVSPLAVVYLILLYSTVVMSNAKHGGIEGPGEEKKL